MYYLVDILDNIGFILFIYYCTFLIYKELFN